jgi:ribosome-associated protein
VLRLPLIVRSSTAIPATLLTIPTAKVAAKLSRVPDRLEIRPGVALPMAEIELRTSRSSGPGGQHANVTASRVEAVFDVHSSAALTDDQKARIAARLGPHVTASAQDTRSQMRNRELALERLAQRLAAALEVRRPRTATRPTAAAKRRRLEGKRRRGELKRARRRPADD